MTDKENAIAFAKFRDTYKRYESQKVHMQQKKAGGIFSWIGESDANIYEAYLKGEQHKNPLVEEMEEKKRNGEL